MALVHVVELLGYLPFIGARLIRKGLESGTQRMKCFSCGGYHEMPLIRLVGERNRLLVESGGSVTHFPCPSCRRGELGLYLFANDAVNGDKETMLRLLRALVNSGALNDHTTLTDADIATLNSLTVADIMFCD